MSERITDWRDETCALLNNRPASLELKTIAAELNISVAWLRMYGRGEIDNPGVVTVRSLNVYLKNYSKKAR